MKSHIYNGILLTPRQRIENTILTINAGIIETLTHQDEFKLDSGRVIDAQGRFITAGFIDLHFHGAMGSDTMDADGKSLEAMSVYCARHGVTTFYPTTWSAANAAITAAIDCVRLNAGRVSGAKIGGIHLEGPYINPDNCGAQLREHIRNPEVSEYMPWLESGAVSIVTCAPEIEGCETFIKDALRCGARVAIGHSSASFEQVKTAADWGVTQATHLFNGMGGLHHRDPGTAGGVLDDERLLAQVICDGVHLHPAVLRLILKTKTHSRIALITDSIRGAGLADGEYTHDGQRILVTDGIASDDAGRLSGSTLPMEQALRNMITHTGCDLQDALAMVTTVPSHEMGLSGHRGLLAPGYDADLVLFDEYLDIKMTIVNGSVVYDKDQQG